MPGINRTMRSAENVWKSRGYLKVLGGKRVYASNEDLKRAWKAFNALVQSSVAELMKRAMLRVSREIPEAILVNQVHDDIELELPDDHYLDERIKLVKQIMREACPEELKSMVNPRIDLKVDGKRIGVNPNA
jgi:DNA polymerase I-like protein with 3'-5' exonuclease and polymerase domains